MGAFAYGGVHGRARVGARAPGALRVWVLLGAAIILGAGVTRAVAAVDGVGQAIGMGQTKLFGPFPNAPGTDKLFRLQGTVNIHFANTTVNVHFCWNAAANAAAPTQCSQVIPIAYPMAGFGLGIDTGNFLLAGPCPETVWVQVRPTQSIDINAAFTHTCNPGAVVPPFTPVVPQNSIACGPFSFLVRTTGRVGNGGFVDGGIGANDPGGVLKLGKGTFVTDGFAAAGDAVTLLEGANVFDVLAGTLRQGAGVTIRGSQGSPALPLTDPFCPIPALTCGGADVDVPPNSSVGPLAPGGYGYLTVGEGSTLTLAPGEFDFCAVRTARNVTVQTTGGIASTINVVGSFRLGNSSTLGPAAATATPILNVGGTLARVGAESELEAFVSAPNAVMSIGRYGTLRGSFCAARSRSDKQIRLECLAPPTTTTTTTTPSTTSTTTTTLPVTACCDVPPGALGTPVPVCLDAVMPDVATKCSLLGGVLYPAGFVCDPFLWQCAPSPPVPPSSFCCECPLPAPPFPHPTACFEGVTPQEFDCVPPCVLHPATTCGPVTETCGGSPSGAFVDDTEARDLP